MNEVGSDRRPSGVYNSVMRKTLSWIGLAASALVPVASPGLRADAPAAAVPLPIFACPSAGRSPLVGGLGGSDYGGLNGESIRSPNNPAKGVFINDRGISEREISDGLSNTLFVAECATGSWSDGQWINGRNLFDQAYAVNWPTWEDEIRSRHPGGAHGLCGDGAVRFIADATDPRILAAACTRNRGEPDPTPWSQP